MGNLTVKAKLLALAFLSAVALVAVGLAGNYGIGQADHAMDRISTVRMPSIHGLDLIEKGQLAVRVANREAPFYENDYDAQDKFAGVMKAKAAAWEIADKGFKIYEPLPQEAEEAVVWKQFQAAWATWKQGESAIDETIRALAANRGEAGQKKLFVKLYEQFESQKAPFEAAATLASKLVAMNEAYAVADQKAGDEAIVASRRLMLVFALAALAVVVGVALYIVRDITGALGGEPRQAADVARRIAEGDLVTPVVVKPGDTGSMMAAMAHMREKLAALVSRINAASESIHVASREIAAGNQDLAQRTEEQAASLEETASSMEELTAAVRQSNTNSREADRLAAGASAQASEGGAVVSQVVQTMSEINESSRKIADIISVIDGIAFQTNILALNAAVEAARAGEQGRGFAVVATEVRALAGRSAEAAKEIKGLIGASVEKVEGGTQLVAKAGETIGGVVQAVQHVSQMVSEITASASEQASGIEQVNQAVTQMDQVTQQNAALVEEASAAAESMKKQAEELRQLVSAFRVDGSAPVAAAVTVTAAPVAVAQRPSAPVSSIASRAKAAPAAPAVRRAPVATASAPLPAKKVAGSDIDGDWAEF